MVSRRVARPLLLQLRSLWRRAPARQPLEAQLRYHIAAAAGGKGKHKEDDSACPHLSDLARSIVKSPVWNC